jgi:pimeloyl-ACP methyl ester carboxylesterase
VGESGYLEVEGGRIYYEVESAGHPLLLIHGGLGSLRMWDDQVPAFAERYRVIRYDTRGFGQTETDEVPFSNHADAIAVLDHADAASAHVVGQSRGAMIALDLVIDSPERCDSLVSVAGGIGGYQPQLPEGTEPPPWDEMEHAWESKEWERLAELETQVWVDGWGQPPNRLDSGLRRKVYDWILDSYRAGKAEGKPQSMNPPAAERLAEVRVPTLVLIGDVDEPGGVDAERHLAGSVGGASVVEFPGVAHMIQLEEPERFNRVVLDFLAEVDRQREGSPTAR